MSDKKLNAPDEVALIKGLSKDFPKAQTHLTSVYALGAAYILGKAMNNVFKKP